MNILLLRPAPGNERFGLGPFFRIEPLGMEYVAAALEARGHHVTLRDLQILAAVARHPDRRFDPTSSAIACMHALEIDDVRDVVARVRTVAPDALIVVGGHSAAAYPAPFFEDGVDAICLDDGERAVPALVDALAAGRPLDEVPGWLLQARLDLAADARSRQRRSSSTTCRCRRGISCRAGGTGTPAFITGPRI